ncbi:MAG: hypothetical protein L3J97_05020, partial [Thermoplasmata archaeon]|nr:hypothetical protein [Thermoplasmata archaeon]
MPTTYRAGYEAGSQRMRSLLGPEDPLASAVLLLLVAVLLLPTGVVTPGHNAAAPFHASRDTILTRSESGSPSRPVLPALSTATAPPVAHVRIDANAFPGPHPRAFGPSGIPPGAPFPPGASLPSVRAKVPRPSTVNASWNNSLCAGLWPYGANDSVSQSYYDGTCYGHDEPSIEFYSDLPGSGGNVSWDVTLPIDRSPSLQQGNLYVAIWFGLTLSDPRSWLNECFLELQFYPDQSWTQPVANGNWIGAAVAWQIEASSGYENPCFYQQLLLDGSSSAFNMNQGDQITVRMTGWPGDPAGEHLYIRDGSTGQVSSLYLVDSVTHLPINTAYPTNAFQNGLQWTPGGEFPVVFAFETGHGANSTVPSNNSYGGCSPGPPPPTRQDPAVPCPSYDAGSWANHSLAPWRIAPPTFFNANTSSVPTQVGFGQDFGGYRLVADLSNGSCAARLGSSWCSYPWYSYSCAIRAFEFGATD